MESDNLPKKTSFAYGKEHQEQMKLFYCQSKIENDSNHEYQRIVLAKKLVKQCIENNLQGLEPKDITIVDIGCSIGTFAIEFSKSGYQTIGIDFDPEAIKIAKMLNDEEKTNAQFFQMDVADWNNSFPKIDIAICFDIFEHLHDDELGSLFHILKKQLTPWGCVVFHTLPQEFDYIFWNRKKGIIQIPLFLRPFRFVSASLFQRLVRVYALIYDIGLVLFKNKTYKQIIKKDGHPNPLTVERLTDIFERSNYTVNLMETGFISEQFRKKNKHFFENSPITHRSLWGIAVPNK